MRAISDAKHASVLVVVPCGKSKIWDFDPTRGAVVATDAYRGVPFRLNATLAREVADRWVILSAKYGFVNPETLIPGPYEVTFSQSATGPVSMVRLREQAEELGLDRFKLIVGLGGVAYRKAVGAAFANMCSQVVFPFAGLPIGRSMQATKAATALGRSAWLKELEQR